MVESNIKVKIIIHENNAPPYMYLVLCISEMVLKLFEEIYKSIFFEFFNIRKITPISCDIIVYILQRKERKPQIYCMCFKQCINLKIYRESQCIRN